MTTAPIDERDIAVAAVSCIGATGPELLNQADRVSALAAILDHAIALFTPVQAATSEPVGRQLVSEHSGWERLLGRDLRHVTDWTALPRGPRSPAELVRPEQAVVSLVGREDLLADLVRWCQSAHDQARGAGKNRLAAELASRRARQGWARPPDHRCGAARRAVAGVPARSWSLSTAPRAVPGGSWRWRRQLTTAGPPAVLGPAALTAATHTPYPALVVSSLTGLTRTTRDITPLHRLDSRLTRAVRTYQLPE